MFGRARSAIIMRLRSLTILLWLSTPLVGCSSSMMRSDAASPDAGVDGGNPPSGGGTGAPRAGSGAAAEAGNSGSAGSSCSNSAGPGEGGRGEECSGAGRSGGSGAGGSASGPRAVPLPRPSCPEDEPEEGSDCSQEALRCSYGSSARPDCRPTYACTGGAWKATEVFTNASACTEAPPAQCPDSLPEDGAACATGSGIPCEYGSTLCYCPTLCGPASPNHCPNGKNHWHCYDPPEDPECPELPPNLGEGCAQQGVECYYGDPCSQSSGRSFFCREGVWEFADSGSCGG